MHQELKKHIKYLKEAIDIFKQEDNKNLEDMRELVNSMVNEPELNNLTARELRAFHGFRMTLDLCRKMDLDAMQKHIYAHYEGGDVKQALSKLPIYKKFKSIYTNLMNQK